MDTTINIPAITAALKERFRAMESPLTISSRKFSVALPASLAAANAIAAWAKRVGSVSVSDLKPVRIIAKVDTVDGFKAALNVAKKGDGIVYHTGWLMSDRIHDGVLRLVADAAMEAERAGQVTLVQKRVSAFVFEYIAIKRVHLGRPSSKGKMSAGWVADKRKFA